MLVNNWYSQVSKKCIFLVVISCVMLVGVATADEIASTLSYSTKTQDKIVGSTFGSTVGGIGSTAGGSGSLQPEVSFSAENKSADETIELNLLFNNKQINVTIGYGGKEGEIHIKGNDIEDPLMKITESDRTLISRALNAVQRENNGSDVLVSKLARVLNLFDFWPSTLPIVALDLDSLVEKSDNPDPGTGMICGLNLPIPMSKSLCSVFKSGNINVPTYVTNTGTSCPDTLNFYMKPWLAIYRGAVHMTMSPPIDANDIIVKNFVLGTSNCTGRCGRGCNAANFDPVNRDANIYTQACLDHDVCAGYYSLTDSRCNYLFLPCVRDAIFNVQCHVAPTIVAPVQGSKIPYDPKGVQFKWKTNFPGATKYRIEVFGRYKEDNYVSKKVLTKRFDAAQYCTESTTGGWQVDCIPYTVSLPAGNYTWNVIPEYASGDLETSAGTAYSFFEITPQACNSTAVAGNDTAQTIKVSMGKSSGTFTFSYDTYSVKDQMVVSYEGKTLHDTGCVGKSGSVALSYSGTSTEVTVAVTPNCAGETGTAWNFTVGCPN
ncbi:MAG: hypothetical protein HQL01_07850 [Nitrospirae bacterium]|nr:hypothetical protein [Nitrospirota bacterium]